MTPETTKQTPPALPPDVLPPDRDPRGGNAQRHGILSEHVPPSEREGYAAHVQAVRDSTGAAGYLQERLADRAALALWRLDRVARYEAAQSSAAQRDTLQKIEAGELFGPASVAAKAWDKAAAAVGESAQALRADPGLALRHAARDDRHGAYFASWAEGGSADGVPEDDAGALGYVLAGQLLETGTPGADIVRAVTGRPPRKGEALTVEGEEWDYEPQELPALLQLAREHWGESARFRLQVLAQVEHKRAALMRDTLAAAQAAEADALALAALPAPGVLEKVTRYEAHLERILYRALHDLEAARRESAGLDTPGPVRLTGPDLG